jgi:hypothetical protein
MRPSKALPLTALAGLMLFLAVAGVSGCTVHQALQGEPGQDLTTLRPGMTRSQLEAIVGKSDREWTTSEGVRYRLYRYDAGIPPSADQAGANVLMDVLSVGLFELFVLADPALQPGHELQDLAVSYDRNDVVIGIFRKVVTSTALPADGRNPEKQ